MIYKFIAFTVTAIAVYYRPFYSTLLLILFYAEYYNAAVMIYSIKTNKSYCRINIARPDVAGMNLIDIWFTLCKINAFTRVYYIYVKKKKIKLINLLIFFIIYILYIPFRLLKLTYYFVTSKGGFRTSLILLTLNSYDLIQGLQIEVLDKKVYLNCNNLTKLSALILKSNKFLDKNTFCSGMKSLRGASEKFSKKELEYGKRQVDLAVIYDAEGNAISKVPHYTVVCEATSLHATSNTLRLFSANQRVDGIIPSLVRVGAVQPGTVITVGVASVKKIINKSVWVPNSELNVVMANHKEFAIDNNIRNYQIEKQEEFHRILRERFKLGKNIDANLSKGLQYNEFTRDLEAADSNLFQKQYAQVFREIRRDDDAI